jgi:hypothetical protein
VAFTLIVPGVQATETDVTVEGDACTVTEAVPVMLEFWTLVAVMVTVAAEAGAVKRPAAEMAPALAVQVTAEL